MKRLLIPMLMACTDGKGDTPVETAHESASDTSASDSDTDTDTDTDTETDGDGDGWSSPEDCDDSRADVHPGAPDACGDGVDGDCDGQDPPCGLAGPIDLASADFFLTSPFAGYGAGELVTIGDTNGDAHGDLLVASLGADGGDGGAWLVPGPISGVQSLDAVGWWLDGDRSVASGSGRSISMGDVNGDTLDDLLIGAPYEDRAFILLSPTTGDRSVADGDIEIVGAANSYSGHGSALADFNGDGLSDALIGAYAQASGGTGYVVYAPFPARIDLTAQAGATFIGEHTGATLGRVMGEGGDLNGDGIDDILASAVCDSSGASYSGTVYVIHGPVTGTFDLADSDGKLIGEESNSQAGKAVAHGDVDGDGLQDALVGSPDHSQPDLYAGAAYVVAGPAQGEIWLSSATAVIRGSTDSQNLGSGLDAGDLDQDGFDDIVVGASGDSTLSNFGGAAYVFLGPLGGTLGGDDAQSALLGSRSTGSVGAGVAVGDLDADLHPDIVLGAPSEQTGGNAAGAVYGVFWD